MELSRTNKGDLQAHLAGIPEGPEGVRVTLDIMRRMVLQARADPAIRSLAESIVRGTPGKDFIGEARAIFNWVRANIRYLQDVNGVETIRAPIYLLQTRQGDCDDIVVLMGALLETIGHPVRFVAIATMPDTFDHVFLQTLIGEKWVSADATENHPFGWQPPDVISRMIRHV